MAFARFIPWQGAIPKLENRWPQFQVGFERTLSELLDEAELLGATEVLIETAFPLSSYTKAGRPPQRGVPAHQAVRVALTTRQGPLEFTCGTYDTWHANLRGIRLTMEALRDVDRWGAASGRQYTGWKAIEGGDPLEILKKFGGKKGTAKEIYLRAVKATHPDVNDGDRSQYDYVESAARRLRMKGVDL